LTPENQPVLYEFVNQICKKVSAPPPTRIELDCDYNASALFRQGWLSFGKNDLVLTLGVPLIASQTSEQLASVIAHDFGHFRQGQKMKAHYMIRSLSGWFMNSAYQGAYRAEVNAYILSNSETPPMRSAAHYRVKWSSMPTVMLFHLLARIILCSR
jgi:hypothetical protein